ncbi:cephalosporin hydroxylase family protein [Candidatus Pelagibacter sp. Uisw_106]|jgi:cephalosporin hydroxylase|uniref:cephalosporin hydroxylase family protein n=1 Tax=Candidatus Pelagibacter sp. Uisw_106 TaxID=3230984 RepID=UPI0039EBE9FE
MKNIKSSVLKKFKKTVDKNINLMALDKGLKAKSIDWMLHADKYKYTYNYRWMGIPIIKFPNDILALQEIIWKVKPDIIIETGIAHGGSIIFSATMMELIGNNGLVIGVDIDIRKHNKIEIEKSKFSKRIKMLEGSSVSKKILKEIKKSIKPNSKVMVFLDSNHTYSHVKKEMEIYSKLVTKNSYLVVEDTFTEFFPKNYFNNRPWDVGNNPLIAIKEFLNNNKNFKIDKNLNEKLSITETFDGYLKKIK